MTAYLIIWFQARCTVSNPRRLLHMTDMQTAPAGGVRYTNFKPPTTSWKASLTVEGRSLATP